MSAILNIGARALMANQAALQTIGHNIANANTAGYSRQTVVMSAVEGQFTGSGYFGKGVTITDVQRVYSDFLTKQSSLASSTSALDSARSGKLNQLQDVFPGGETGLGASVNDMMNAFGDVVSAPTDLTPRTVVITRASELAGRFNTAATRLSETALGVRQELQDSTATANNMIDKLAALNTQIASRQGSGQQPNDLLDQRDKLIKDLGDLVQISTVAADDGSTNVFVGSIPVVLGASASHLSLQTNPNGQQLTLQVTRGALSSNVDEFSVTGGKIAGLLRFNNKDLSEATNLLGRMALTMTTELNAQNRLGLTLDGNPGGDFFTPITIPNATAVVGSATISATVSDASQLDASDYTIAFNSGFGGVLTKKSDGSQINFNIGGTGNLELASTPGTSAIPGLTVNLAAGSVASGDTFELRPYANAAAAVQVAFSSPRDLAVASNMQVSTSTANGGTVSVTGFQSLVAPPPPDVTITFTSANQYTRSDTGGTTYTYSPGQAIDYASGPPASGWTLTLQGTPKAGDTLTVQDAVASGNTYYKTNAGNASLMLGLRDKAVFDGAPMADGYASLMAQIGVRTQSAQFASDVSQSIASALESDRTAASGVNLDEEAAKLLQYQQAYQAASKLMQVAQNAFDNLIQTVSR